MPPKLTREMLDVLLPKGTIWNFKDNNGLDLLLDGMAENWNDLKVNLDKLATIRNADLTAYVEDMEAEYALFADTLLTEVERRVRLKNAINSRQGFGADWDMQAKLRAAGFTDIFVYPNDPPVDINTFIGNAPNITCSTGFLYTCGQPGATCAENGAVLIVNGRIYDNQTLLLGTYPIPTANYWHNVFFVGGAATFNASGEILTLDQIQIPLSRKDEVIRLIVKYKPIHSWCILRVLFV